MARTLTIYNNFLAPSGYVLIDTYVTMADGKKYNKIWSPIWDIILNKGKDDITQEERKDNKNWTWHGVYMNKVYFDVNGGNIINYFQTEGTPPSIRNMYVIGGKNGNINKGNKRATKKSTKTASKR